MNRRDLLVHFAGMTSGLLLPKYVLGQDALGAGARPAAFIPPPTSPHTAPLPAEVAPDAAPPAPVRGVQYCVYDPTDGRPYLSEMADLQRQPASLAKMAVLGAVFAAIRSRDTRFRLSSRVRIPDALRDFELHDLARTNVRIGQRYSLETLLKAAGSKSCAVSTLALVNHLGEPQVLNWGGTFEERIEKCVRVMNRLAAHLDMNDTHFYGVTGDKSEGNLSTPHDMAKLVYFLEQQFHNLCEIAMGDPVVDLGDLSDIRQHSSRSLYNDDLRIKWAKTGKTDPAGLCEALYAEIDGRPVILILFGIEGHGSTPEACDYDASIKRYNTIMDLLDRVEPMVAAKTAEEQIARAYFKDRRSLWMPAPNA